MALSTYEQLWHLYNSPSLRCSVSCFLRADQVGALVSPISTLAAAFSLPNTPTGNSVRSNTAVGDIIQVADEDMRVISPGGPLGIFEREYAGTTFDPRGYPAGTAIWTWKDMTDRIESDHGIEALVAIERRFEYKLNTYGTTSANLRVRNADRFWDGLVALPTGVSSFRHRWLRFYLQTFAGSLADHRAVATMMIESVEVDESEWATLRLVGIGSLLRREAEATNAKNGREWLTYTPTSLVVEKLLESVEGLRTSGEGDAAGLPIHWRRKLSTAAARSIAAPDSNAIISAHGKPNDFAKPSSSVDILARNADVPSGSMAGGFTSAMAWDPQATGAFVVTGDPATVGRLYFGIGSDIWEFDPVSREGKVACATAGGSGNRIRRLWYNALDTATAGKPKIHGAAWADYPTNVSTANYSERAVAARLFRWNGGAVLSNSSNITNFWPGTHFFRDGASVNFGAGGVGAQPSMGIGNALIASTESLPLWFEQTISSHSNALWSSANSSVIFSKRSSLTAGNTDRTKADGVLSSGVLLAPGIGFAADSYGVAGAASVLKGFDVVHFNNTSRMNLRFTLGQQGACCLYSTNAARNNAADTGAIVYCTINTTTGIISVNSWEAESGTGVTGIRICASPAEQPCSMAGNGDEVCANAQHILFVGEMVWSETGNSEGRIYKYIDLGTETAYYLGASDAVKYYTPLWLEYVHISTTINGIFTSTYRRDLCSASNAFGYYSGLTSATVTNWSPTYAAASLLHAVTFLSGASNIGFGMDTAGRLVRVVVNPTTCAIIGATPQDRGFCPIDGETWSATDRLAPFGSTQCYGVSSPVWPFGNDIRGGRADGLYVLWKLDDEMWDTYDLGYFEDKTVEEALADLAFASNAVWGFDYDGRGGFEFSDRVQSSTPVVTLGGGQDFSTRIRRRAAFDEIENPVVITPWTLRSGEIEARVDLSSTPKDIGGKQDIEIQSPDNKRKLIQLICATGGRVGAATFKAMVQGGVSNLILVATYTAGVATSTIDVTSPGRAAGGPYLETTTAQRNTQMQIPADSRVRLPDGTERTVSSFAMITAYTVRLTLSSSWTPTTNIFAGSGVEVYLEVDRQWSDYSITTGDPNGYLLTSSFEWQEIGSGEPWATGVLIRFTEPPDDSVDINYNEYAWAPGNRIVIDVAGLDGVANTSAKITAHDAEASRIYGKRELVTDRGRLPARKAFAVAQARSTENARPRWVYSITTALAPYLKLFDVVAVYSPKLIPTSPHTDNVTIRSIRHDLRSGVSTIEAIGSTIDSGV